MGSAASNALHWDAEAVESIGGQDVLLYATALDIAANHETKWRAKQWARCAARAYCQDLNTWRRPGPRSD